jgi:hypothetical protein
MSYPYLSNYYVGKTIKANAKDRGTVRKRILSYLQYNVSGLDSLKDHIPYNPLLVEHEFNKLKSHGLIRKSPNGKGYITVSNKRFKV